MALHGGSTGIHYRELNIILLRLEQECKTVPTEALSHSSRVNRKHHSSGINVLSRLLNELVRLAERVNVAVIFATVSDFLEYDPLSSDRRDGEAIRLSVREALSELAKKFGLTKTVDELSNNEFTLTKTLDELNSFFFYM